MRRPEREIMGDTDDQEKEREIQRGELRKRAREN